MLEFTSLPLPSYFLSLAIFALFFFQKGLENKDNLQYPTASQCALLAQKQCPLSTCYIHWMSEQLGLQRMTESSAAQCER